ncbi:MAG: lipocalin family protein [Desulfobacterales bacterium]
MITKGIVAILMLIMTGCAGIPKGITPVDGFEIERYMGLWHEIARLDHSFERGLIKVTAQYKPRQGRGITVINQGYDPLKNKWREIVGKAFFVNDPNIGRLKVSFFGPFYAGYNIIALDKDEYSYAMVCGPSLSYLWILARDRDLDPEILISLVNKARDLGFKVENLIYLYQ